MLWIGIALTFGVGIVSLLVGLSRHSVKDLGAVSPRWIAEHHIDRTH